MKRGIKCLALVVCTAALLLSGCRGAPAASNSTPKAAEEGASAPKTKLSFWTYCTTPERDRDYERFSQLLTEAYPEVELDYLGVTGDIPTFVEKLDVAIAANTAPDFTDYYDSKYISSGFYEPLDAYFNTWEEKDKINAAMVAEMRRMDPQNGRLYAVPFSSQPWGMWVRTDLLSAAGLPVPQTWEQFFTAVEQLTDKSQDQYGIALRGGAGSSLTLEMLMYSYSGLTEYFDEQGNSTINDPRHLEFAERYLGLYNRYSAQDDLAKGWTQLSAAFQAGKAAIIFHNFGSGESMDIAFNKNDTVFRAAMLPKSESAAQRSQYVLPRAVAMNSSSAHKELVSKAMELFCSPEVQIPRCKTQGEVPTHLDALTAPDYLGEARPHIRLGIEITTTLDEAKLIHSPLYLPEYTRVQTQIEPLIQKVMAGQMSAQEMLDQWALLLEEAQRENAAPQ